MRWPTLSNALNVFDASFGVVHAPAQTRQQPANRVRGTFPDLECAIGLKLHRRIQSKQKYFQCGCGAS